MLQTEENCVKIYSISVKGIKMKKILLISICLTFIFTLVACNKPSENTSEKSVSEVSSAKTTSTIKSESPSASTIAPEKSENERDNFDEEDKLIFDFLVSGKDVDTVNDFDKVANTSTAVYANVPDYYLNLSSPNEGDIFASPDGTTSGDGSFDNPYDVYTALSKVQKGKTLYLKEGVYTLTKRINLYTSGTRSEYVNIYAYDGKRAILDFSSMVFDGNNKGMALYSDFVRIYGLDFKGAGDNGLTVIGSYNIIENCKFYDNRDSGLQIMGNGSDFTAWPHDNLVLNCTAFNNADVDGDNPLATGENADGFACKLANGNNNTFDGCIAYCNIDDGWDLFAQNQANGRTIIVNCVAFKNGYMLDGSRTDVADGNGFKLGSWNFPSNSYIANSVAFDNYDHGFTCNCNVGAFEMVNCTAYNNSLKGLNEACNFNLGRAGYDCSERFLSNLLSISTNTCYDKTAGTVRNSLVTLYDKGYFFIEKADRLEKTAIESVGINKNFTTEDLVASVSSPTISANIHDTMRNADLTVNLKDFLKVKENSPIYTMGQNNAMIGANLNLDNYYTPEKVDELIDAIGKAEKTSESYSKIYKAVKRYCNLKEIERKTVLNRTALVDSIIEYTKN